MSDLLLQQASSNDVQHSKDLLLIYDNFVEFNSSCAFFCDAVATMLLNSTEFDRATIEGVSAFAEQIKLTAAGLKRDFKRIRTEYPAKDSGSV